MQKADIISQNTATAIQNTDAYESLRFKTKDEIKEYIANLDMHAMRALFARVIRKSCEMRAGIMLANDKETAGTSIPIEKFKFLDLTTFSTEEICDFLDDLSRNDMSVLLLYLILFIRRFEK